jgi:CheY-like chemotaxis protein
MRIVVVDDNPDTCAFMRAALQGGGYEVETANEGAQGLDLLRSRDTDLLITDIFMPGQEGFETITRCKAEFPRTRIVAMSAGTIPGMPHDFLSSAALLVDATLRKPFTATRLLQTVDTALRR